VALNLLMPGAGQLRMQEPLRGALWFAAEGAAVAVFVIEARRAQAARQDYLQATTAAEIESRYQDYDSAYRLSWISGGVAAAVYLAAQFDLALVTRRQVTLACRERQGAPELALRITW
jgi:hypothetical protein